MLFGVSFDIAVNQVLFILLLIEEVNYNDAVVDHEDLFEGGVFVFGLDRIFQLVLMLDDCALRVHNEIDNIEINSGIFFFNLGSYTNELKRRSLQKYLNELLNIP